MPYLHILRIQSRALNGKEFARKNRGIRRDSNDGPLKRILQRECFSIELAGPSLLYISIVSQISTY